MTNDPKETQIDPEAEMQRLQKLKEEGKLGAFVEAFNAPPEQLRQARGLSVVNQKGGEPCATPQQDSDVQNAEAHQGNAGTTALVASNAAQTSYPDAPPVPAPAQTPEGLADLVHDVWAKQSVSKRDELIRAIRQALAAKDEELKTLRLVIRDAVSYLPFGGSLSADSSLEFLQDVPGEFRSQISRLQRDVETKARELSRLRADLAAQRARREETERTVANLTSSLTSLSAVMKSDEAKAQAAIQRAEQAEARAGVNEVAFEERVRELKAERAAHQQTQRELAQALNKLGICRSTCAELVVDGDAITLAESLHAKEIELTQAREQGAKWARETTHVQALLNEAREQLAKVTEQMNAAMKSWRLGQEQLAAEAAKWDAARRVAERTPYNAELSKALAQPASEALRARELEAGKRGYMEAMIKADLGQRISGSRVAFQPNPPLAGRRGESMKIYVSGPMTGLPEMNFPAFKAASERLRSEGNEVVDPSDVLLPKEARWGDCMRVHIPMILQCDGMLMLPGWEKSKGARLERHLAIELGLHVEEEV